MSTSYSLKKTPLHKLHQKYNAHFVNFAGYEMPLYYKIGMLQEHLHTRKYAGFFDVSHMGQILFPVSENLESTLKDLQKLTPSPLLSLKPGECLYTVFTGPDGGCIDDLIIEIQSDKKILCIVNASRKDVIIDHLRHFLPKLHFNVLSNQSLLALQGPKACEILSQLIPDVQSLKFMKGNFFSWEKYNFWITRSGYTGEDGFEISLPSEVAESFSSTLLQNPLVKLIGLGARNTLRLEAGLPLYGNELNSETSFLECSISWILGKPTPKKVNCIGHETINQQISNPLSIEKKRIGIIMEEKSIPREGCIIESIDNEIIGQVTSGAYSPSLKVSIAQGFVKTLFAKKDTKVYVIIRGKKVKGHIARLPFIKPKYFK